MKRSELFAAVWSEPLTTLAGRFGCSPTWIRSVCASNDIPTPGRGFWARLNAGQAQAVPPLPAGPDVELGLGLPDPKWSPPPRILRSQAIGAAGRSAPAEPPAAAKESSPAAAPTPAKAPSSGSTLPSKSEPVAAPKAATRKQAAALPDLVEVRRLAEAWCQNRELLDYLTQVPVLDSSNLKLN